jgi:RHS repeat-associated protein
MTSERNKLTSETKRYYWDSESRMVKYEHLASDISPMDTTALYKYDIYGRRIQKDVNGSVINFMWEGDNVSLELDSANQPIRKYFTEMGMDDYFAHLNYAEVTNWSQVFSDWYPQGWYGYIKDQVGTIYKVWDHNTRTIADSRTYDSFGNLISQSGTTKTPLGFQGKYYDQESGLNYFYHRYYNPTLGRFISEDPIALYGGPNMYEVMGNDGINYRDPLGLDRIHDLGKEFHKWFGGYYKLNQKIMDTTGKIEDIIGGTIKNVVSFNWCCFANCIGNNKELLDVIALQIVYNIMVTTTAEYNPGFYSLLINKPIWQWNELIFNLASLAQIVDEVGTCFKICSKH